MPETPRMMLACSIGRRTTTSGVPGWMTSGRVSRLGTGDAAADRSQPARSRAATTWLTSTSWSTAPATVITRSCAR